MIKHIIFDWSGVINDCLESHLCATNKIFAHFGLQPLTLEETRENWIQPYMRFYNKYIPSLTHEQEKVLYGQALRECPPGRPYAGMVQLVYACKAAGITMAVLTSDLPEFFFPQVKEFGLDGMFIDMAADVHDKSEEIYKIIVRNHFDKKSTAFIGDSNHEVEEGKAAGVQTIAVTWGFSTEPSLRALTPDFVATDLEELRKIILGA